MPPKQGATSHLIRAIGFIKKELIAVRRQPRLIVTLIVAPFIILLIFGLGYRTEPPPFETLLVLPGEESTLAAEQEDLSEAFGEAIDLQGTTTNASEARSSLRSGEVDLLIIGPANALAALDEGEQAEFVIVHSEVDPVIRGSIDLLAQLSVDELNRRILENVVANVQAGSNLFEEPLADLRSSTDALVSALEEQDEARARASREEVNDQLDEIANTAATTDSFYSSVAASLGTDRESAFESLRSQLEMTESGSDRLENAREFEAQLDQLSEQLTQAQNLDPGILVSPFNADVQDIADLPGTPALFYAPGTLAVLIQHLAVTFASLSVVRDRQLGFTELFRASPLGTTETLLGKYLAFLMLATSLAAVFIGLMFAFGVTMRGSLGYFSLTVVLVIAASLGLGFLLAGAARTEGQAVQYAMMLLLFSIFFTGLILPLEQLIPPVRAVSYLVPGTYGISALHNVMFRGLNPAPAIVFGLAAYSVLTLIGSWFVLRRDIGIQRSKR